MMASAEDKTMIEESAGQKRRLAVTQSFDEEMDFDGFSELDKLDPVDTSATIPQQPQHPPTSSQPPSNQPASVPPNNSGNLLQNGTVNLNSLI